MPSTRLVKNILYQAAGFCNDLDPQFHHWTEAEYVQALNEAQAVLAKYLPISCSRIDSIKLKAGCLQSIDSVDTGSIIPSIGSAPTSDLVGFQLLNVMCNMGSNGLVAGTYCQPVSLDLMNNILPNWRAVTGTEVECFMFNPQVPKQFEVYPSPAADADVWVRVAWIALPDLLQVPEAGDSLYAYAGSSQTTLSVSDEYADEVLNYVVARLNMKDADYADPDKASRFGSLFTGALNAKVKAATGNNPNLKRLPLAAEPMERAQ